MESPKPEEVDDSELGPPTVDLLVMPDMLGDDFPKEVKQAFRKVRDLLKSNKDALSAAQVLLDAYQLQQWAMYAMTKLGVEHQTMTMTLEYVKLKALSPFKEEPLRSSLRDGTLPFLSTRMLEHAKMREEDKPE